MLHRTVYGSLERFIGILIEHYNGRLPVWLAPVQVRILSFTQRNKAYAEKVIKEFQKEIPDLRIDSDFKDTTVPAKVKDAEMMRIPLIIMIGDKEQKAKTLAVRRNAKVKFGVKLGKFIKDIKKEISERK